MMKNKIKIIIRFLYAVLIFNIAVLNAQDNSRLEVIKYGTENEVASLIQTLRTEGSDELDNELINITETTRNTKILVSVFGFFGDREKNDIENRAIRIIEERGDEANETVFAAVDYTGKIKSSKAVPALMELLDTEERRFMNSAFRALGRAGSSDKETADSTADYLIEFYTYRDPGDENRREVITALGMTGSSLAMPLLSDIASNNDERIPLRIAALEGLAKIAVADGLNAILECVNANDPNIRSAAVGALGPFSGDNVDKAILDAFRDSYYRTRIAACQASRERKFTASVPYLKFRAERDEVPNVREEAIRALGAIAGDEALIALDSLFNERKNTDRVRLLAAEMLSKNAADKYFLLFVKELDEAKSKNQTALYNGFLKITGEAVIEGDKRDIENLAGRFMSSGGVTEKLYGLDMALNNNLTSLANGIKALSREKSESLSRKAKRTAEKLGIELES
ncbi:MAG: HEAT repeat domain-containing protein [Treponema sp.]|jgi:HEAT repeat protein|nr:HEAT repeat domain-containing protein [Treponema sp.]